MENQERRTWIYSLHTRAKFGVHVSWTARLLGFSGYQESDDSQGKPQSFGVWKTTNLSRDGADINKPIARMTWSRDVCWCSSMLVMTITYWVNNCINIYIFSIYPIVVHSKKPSICSFFSHSVASNPWTPSCLLAIVFHSIIPIIHIVCHQHLPSPASFLVCCPLPTGSTCLVPSIFRLKHIETMRPNTVPTMFFQLSQTIPSTDIQHSLSLIH